MNGRWITSPDWKVNPADPLPVLGTTFSCGGNLVSATLRISGLGVFAASVNGAPVSADLLEPGYSDYAQRVELCTYDVSALVVEGDNTLVVELGPGMYRSQQLDDRWTKIRSDYGDLAVNASLTLAYPDGTTSEVATDTGWRATLGQTRSSNWTGGEDFDANVPLDTSPAGLRSWPTAVDAAVPAGIRLSAKTTPPLRVREVVSPVGIREVGDGTQVVDFGVNFAGWVELDLPAHASVRLRPAELLHEDGTIDPRTEGWDPVYHTVRSGSRPLTWHPRFCYNGLRYLEISGLDQPLEPGSVRGLVIAADTRATGEFACSDPTLAQLHRIIHRAVTSNMYSVFTDCPHREKLNFIEQLHLAFPVVRWNYDVRAILANTLLMIREAQGADGHLGLYVPEWDPFPDPWRGDVNWGGALVHVPWLLHLAYDDVTVLRENYAAMSRYARHLLDMRVDGLVRYGLGDWDGREARAVPFVATASLARLLSVLAQVADALGEDGKHWQEESDLVAGRVRSEFWNADDLIVGTDTIGETAIALHYGVVPPDRALAVVDLLEQRIAADGYYLDVGEVGLPALIDVLAAHDRHETLYRFACQSERPGYGYMLRHGATALTETWDGPTYGISQNHFMLGAIDGWFYAHVAGLQQANGDRGFRDLVVRPRPCGGLTSARASYETARGIFSSSWTIEDGTFRLEVEIPPGARATIETPDGHRTTVGSGKHQVEGALS